MKRLQSIGVSVRETKPDIRIAMLIVTANSWRILPRIPPMKSTGMKTATRERVMDKIVKLISLEPVRAACKTGSPFSIWRIIFSSITIASSTTNPTERVRAIRVMLLTLNPIRYIAAKVPTMEKGSARLGIMVADRLRRKRKMTSTTRHSARKRVNLTSLTDSRMDTERS